MAISLSKFVDIRTTWPESSPPQRTFGGLVFTTETPINISALGDLEETLKKNEPVEMTEEEIREVFTEMSDVYKFAKRYYGYYNDKQKSPCALKVVVMATKASTTSATAQPETTGSEVKDSETAKGVSSTTKVKVLKAAPIMPLKASTGYETPSEALARVTLLDNDFGSFMFLGDFTLEELKAAYVKNATFNGRYLAVHGFVSSEVSEKDASDKVGDIGEIGDPDGLCVVYGHDKYTAAIPMAIFAATDYDSANGVVCQMFKQHDDETPTVASDDVYNILRKKHVNFYGLTQSNGKKIAFYMPGYNVDGTDTAIYCNEIWFKSRCTTELFNLLMTEKRIPANDDGITMVKDVVLDCCVSARTNGVFMAKTPSTAEQRNIKKLCSSVGLADEQADAVASSVETNGYGVVAYLGKNDDGDNAVIYYVFYGTADSIRFVKGNDVLVSGE